MYAFLVLAFPLTNFHRTLLAETHVCSELCDMPQIWPAVFAILALSRFVVRAARTGHRRRCKPCQPLDLQLPTIAAGVASVTKQKKMLSVSVTLLRYVLYSPNAYGWFVVKMLVNHTFDYTDMRTHSVETDRLAWTSRCWSMSSISQCLCGSFVSESAVNQSRVLQCQPNI